MEGVQGPARARLQKTPPAAVAHSIACGGIRIPALLSPAVVMLCLLLTSSPSMADSGAPIDEADCAILLSWQPYASLVGGDKSCSGRRCSDFPGVDCAKNGSVIGLADPDPNGKLKGALPPQWSGLQSLQSLSLPGNSLTGSLPPEWGSLPSLSSLDLANNSLSGPLPASWVGTQLERVILSNNSLHGTLPAEWGSLSIFRLELAGNKLSGPLPTEWSTWGRLGLIDLSNNSLSGTIPPKWIGEEGISMYLGNNKLSGPLPHFEHAVRVLDLANNSLSGALPPEYADIPSLEILTLAMNKLSGTLPSEWGGMSSLKYLYLYQNSLEGALPGNWSMMQEVRAILLSKNSLTGPLPSSWGALRQLQYLDLHTNRLSGPLPADWASLSSLVALELGSNQLTGTTPDRWAALQSLTSLMLYDNNLSGQWPRINLRALSVLDAHGSSFSGALDRDLAAAMPSITFLDMSNTQLSGTFPAVLPPRVVVLLLANSSLNGSLPATWKARRLQVLSVGVDKVDGQLPTDWLTGTSFPNLTLLDIGKTLKRNLKQDGWRKRVCLNDTLFSSSAAKRLQEALPGLLQTLQSVSPNTTVGTQYANQLLSRLPREALNIRSLCGNSNALLMLAIGWGLTVLVMACTWLGWSRVYKLLPDIGGGQQSKLMHTLINLKGTAVAVLYWYDVITDVLVIRDVWGHWPAYCLTAFLVMNYVSSAAVVCLYLHRRAPGRAPWLWSVGLPVLVAVMPILDTVAAIQVVLRDIGLHVELPMDVDEYQHMRNVAKLCTAGIPTAIITSAVYARGNNPHDGLFLSQRAFVSSLAASMLLLVVTWAMALWKSTNNLGRVSIGSVRRHLQQVLLGRTLPADGAVSAEEKHMPKVHLPPSAGTAGPGFSPSI